MTPADSDSTPVPETFGDLYEAQATRLPEAPFDARGHERGDPTDSGPFQVE